MEKIVQERGTSVKYGDGTSLKKLLRTIFQNGITGNCNKFCRWRKNMKD